MHQSFVLPATKGPGNSGAFNFLVFKALLNALHCRDKFMVKSLVHCRSSATPEEKSTSIFFHGKRSSLLDRAKGKVSLTE